MVAADAQAPCTLAGRESNYTCIALWMRFQQNPNMRGSILLIHSERNPSIQFVMLYIHTGRISAHLRAVCIASCMVGKSHKNFHAHGSPKMKVQQSLGLHKAAHKLVDVRLSDHIRPCAAGLCARLDVPAHMVDKAAEALRHAHLQNQGGVSQREHGHGTPHRFWVCRCGLCNNW